MTTPVWLQLNSQRVQPYTLDDISVIIPSAAGRYTERWKWFWPQYVSNTHQDVVARTYVPCDPEEIGFMNSIGITNTIVTSPRGIVVKTVNALNYISTRLTFRLANDIMVVRSGWEDVLLTQFNAEERFQIISEVQHGVSPDSVWEDLNEWQYFKDQYPVKAVSAKYPHGSRLFAQTAVWNAYYRLVLRYTPHNCDELIFSQLANGDGTVFTHFGGINSFLSHKGFSNKDFTPDYVNQLKQERTELEQRSDNPGFRRIG